MDEAESRSYSKWECQYPLVLIPKCRRKTLYEPLRRHLGEVFRNLAEQKECRILEGHLMSEHVHRLIAIPPNGATTILTQGGSVHPMENRSGPSVYSQVLTCDFRMVQKPEARCLIWIGVAAIYHWVESVDRVAPEPRIWQKTQGFQGDLITLESRTMGNARLKGMEHV
jgi:hypothetical protein